MSLLIANCNGFFYIHSIITLSCELRCHRAGSQPFDYARLDPYKWRYLGTTVSNINMKAKNKVKGSQVVVELFALFLAFMLMLAKNPFNIISKPINVLGMPILVRIGQKL